MTEPAPGAGPDPIDEELAAMVADETASAPSSATAPSDLDAVEDVVVLDPIAEQIAALTAERDQFKDIALRLQADFENYRKRAAGQQADEVDRMTGRVVENLLPVLDACEAAFAHGAVGVEPIWSSLLGALQKQGLEVLDLAEKPFDPNLADAVMHEEGDGAEPMVSEVLRTGYRWKNRVLRAAMVKVRG